MKTPRLTVIGAGLAGAEAAWQAAQRGVPVTLYEMRPHTPTPAHKSGLCAELVCSNSLGSRQPDTAPFLLKQELLNLGSLVIRAAEKHAVPAGGALAVNRELFAQEITASIQDHPHIELVRREVEAIPQDRPLIIATGPLTSPKLAAEISRLIGQEYLYFYDALSPIIDGATIDHRKAYFASRYGKGGADYLNCPLSEEQYRHFVRELLAAEKVEFKSFEKPLYFEGCMPIEEMASRGEKTLAFGPMKPVGLLHPVTGERFYAVVQLRRENIEGTAFNMVGFQTKLTYPEQRRVFSLIPGLEKAEFFRYGGIHRNTFINAPAVLNRDLTLRGAADLFFAGQITGVEGYVESCAMGLVAGIAAARKIRGEDFSPPPPETAMGALLAHVSERRAGTYQPMNINFGLFSTRGLSGGQRDRGKRHHGIIQRALAAQEDWQARCT